MKFSDICRILGVPEDTNIGETLPNNVVPIMCEDLESQMIAEAFTGVLGDWGDLCE